MSVKITSESENENGCIAAGLALRGMRLAMENKDLLKEAGSMYIGTGRLNKVKIVMENGTETQFEVPETIAVKPPSELTNGAIYGIKLTVDGNAIVTGAQLVKTSEGSASI